MKRTKIGTVTLTAPEPSWRVTDGRAWREWVQVRPNAEALTAIVREYGSLGSRLAAIEAVSARGGAQ